MTAPTRRGTGERDAEYVDRVETGGSGQVPGRTGPEDVAPGLRAHRVSDERTLLIEADNGDAWLSSDLLLEVEAWA